MPDGRKLVVLGYKSSPKSAISDTLKQQIQLTLVKRYNVISNGLDLSCLSKDPGLRYTNFKISKPEHFLDLMDMISEMYPELHELSLSCNTIGVGLKYLHPDIGKRLSKLKILKLYKTMIHYVSWLWNLSGLPLEVLITAGNFFCSTFKSKVDYMRQIKERFPNLRELDLNILPPEQIYIPVIRLTLEIQQKLFTTIQRFVLQNYFSEFDNDTRHRLAEKYHENAIFSLTMTKPVGQSTHQDLDLFGSNSRNLLLRTDPYCADKLVKKGRSKIIECLEVLPTTQHDLQSIKLDLGVFTPQMYNFTITGNFKVLHRDGSNTRATFFRSFVMKPLGCRDFCILNDMLHIFVVKDEMDFIEQMGTLNLEPGPNEEWELLDDRKKSEMAQRLSDRTGLDATTSTICLHEAKWNFHRAVSMSVMFLKEKRATAADQQIVLKDFSALSLNQK